MFGRERCHVIEQHVNVEPAHVASMEIACAEAMRFGDGLGSAIRTGATFGSALAEWFSDTYPTSPSLSLEAALASVGDRGMLTDAVVADNSVAGQRLLDLLVTLVKRLPIGGKLVVPKARMSTLVALLRDPFDGDNLHYATVLESALRGRSIPDLLVMALGLSVHEHKPADRDAPSYEPMGIYRKETSVINHEFLSASGESKRVEVHGELRQ